MEEKIKKYAKFLIAGCLNLKANDKLFIIGYTINKDFIDIVIAEAKKLGINNIETLIQDPYLMKEYYLKSSYEELINNPLFDKTKYNTMAKERYAFLNLYSPLPDFFNEVEEDLINKVNTYQTKSISKYHEYQSKGLIKWNISSVPNSIWATSIFGTPDIERLWNYIFDICLINEENPKEAWDKKMQKLNKRAEYLNNLNIDYLVYQNKLGTNITIGLSDDYLFMSAAEQNIVNMPSEEIFTSPHRLRVNGRVYASKILIHNNQEIKDFWLEFKDGKVTNYDAKKGLAVLKSIIDTDTGSSYLGEVALVDIDSPIAKTNMIFKNTLYDENASCHLALGTGFPECIKNGLNKSKKELKKDGLNFSEEHVDFFIGTDDLMIKAVLKNQKEVIIMENGIFKGGE